MQYRISRKGQRQVYDKGCVPVWKYHNHSIQAKTGVAISEVVSKSSVARQRSPDLCVLPVSCDGNHNATLITYLTLRPKFKPKTFKKSRE